jgi:BASS family bile acid:Na+ symporter
MSDVLAVFSQIATLVFAVASMLTVGLSYTIAQILAPLRDGRAVLRTLLANFVLVPLLAYVIVRVLALPLDASMGLLLLATAAGSPFMIKLTGVAGGHIGMAAGLLVMLVVATVGFMPIVVPLITPDVTVDAMAIAMPLVLSMLLPLVAGLIIDSRLPRLAARLRAVTNPLSTLALLALVLSLVALHLNAILPLLTAGTALAALSFPLGAFGIGQLLERRGVITSDVLALGTAQRNGAAALVVATQNFEDRAITLMIVFVSIVTLALLFLLAWMMGKRRPPSGTAAADRGSQDAP